MYHVPSSEVRRDIDALRDANDIDEMGVSKPAGVLGRVCGGKGRVKISVPLTNPYPQAGVRGIYKNKIFYTYYIYLLQKTKHYVSFHLWEHVFGLILWNAILLSVQRR